MLKQKLSQKLTQKLSPQQIQLMKLLQVPTASLEQRIKEELEENPALEEGVEKEEVEDSDLTKDSQDDAEPEKEVDEKDDLDLSDYLAGDDEIPDFRTKSNNYADPDEERTIPIAVENSLHDFLGTQLDMLHLSSDLEKELADHLLGSIDEDGYMRRPLDAIVDDLAFTRNIETEEEVLEKLLLQIQAFEPRGVGARNLQECLVIQLKKKIEKDEDTEENQRALTILTKYFEAFSKKHYEKLQRQLKASEQELKEAVEVILKLNPKPGSAFSSSPKKAHYIIPDFIIENIEGELSLKLNARNAPELRVSDNFRDMMKDYNKSKSKDKKQKEAIMFIKQKIDSARWFIEAIKQRQQTMLNSMQAILNYQYEYFLTGDETSLKPMILKDIAEITGLDISTISRVSNSKYAQTEFGTFLLKSFFSESLQTESGEEVSTREVKKILQDLIDNEDKKKPLSDQKLTEALIEKGYNIARRTVAKYREQLDIPVARLRKEL